MTRSVDPEGRAARFIALEVHEAAHDRLVWGMRQHRDAVTGWVQRTSGTPSSASAAGRA